MPAINRYQKFAFSLLLFTLTTSSFAETRSGAKHFSAGVSESREGNYQQAIQHFLNAEGEGYSSAAMQHNLGVAYYKTGQYGKALNAFERAGQSDKLTALSYYNRGLVEEKRERNDAARSWFQRAHDAARTEKLRRLAELKLGLRETTTVPYAVFLAASAGSDSNPQLVDDTINPTAEEESDTFFSTLAYGRYHVGGDASRGLYLTGIYYQRRYNSEDEEDSQSTAAGLGYIYQAEQWHLTYEMLANQLKLAGDNLQQSLRASLEARRRLQSGRYFDTRLSVDSIEGDEDNGYDYLSGEEAKWRLRYGDRAGSLHWRIAYEHSYNSRDDLLTYDATGAIASRFDTSPQRNEVTAKTIFILSPGWRADLSGAYRVSNYRDAEIRAGVEQDTRKDDRWEARVGLEYRFGRGWSTRLEAVHWDNDSNTDAFDYARNEATLSIAKQFY